MQRAAALAGCAREAEKLVAACVRELPHENRRQSFPRISGAVERRGILLEGADTLFSAVINGKLHVPINDAYALKDAARAHTDIPAHDTVALPLAEGREPPT